jgi:hypothetical protein
VRKDAATREPSNRHLVTFRRFVIIGRTGEETATRPLSRSGCATITRRDESRHGTARMPGAGRFASD